LDKDVMIGNALIDMYVRCGLLGKAQETLDKLAVQDAASWNTLIAGYLEHENHEQALSCLHMMRSQRVSPNEITLTTILKSVGSIGFTAKGREIHSELMKKGYLESDLIVGNALIDMYARCGSLYTAQAVIDNMRSKEVIAWNALLSGGAQLGECENVVHIFNRMMGVGIRPNGITFISVLKACSRASFVSRGFTYFGNMTKDFGILPTLEHSNCIIHLLNCAGELGKAIEIVCQISQSDTMIWRSMLYSCRKWGNLKLALCIFEYSIGLKLKSA
jgi:pentatricopeptide repeat protein